MTTSAGTLTIDLAAGIARLEADMKKARKDVTGAMQGIDGAVSTVKKAFAALGVAVSAGAFAALIKNAMASIDATAKLADRLGIAADKMAGLSHAADLAGVSQETLNTGLRGMTRSVADAAMGLGAGARAFQQLGLSARELSAQSPDQQLERIMTALAGVENVTQRNAIAQQIFGARASEMLNLVADGADGIRRATEDTRAWGVALSRVDAAKVEMANDAMGRAKLAASGLVNTIAVALSPLMKKLGNDFADAAKKSNGFRKEVVSGMEAVSVVVAYSANVVRVMQLMWLKLKVVASDSINSIVQGLASVDRRLTDFLNSFSQSWVGQQMGVPMKKYAASLQLAADVTGTESSKIRKELESLAKQDFPADKVLAWFAEVKAAAQKGAEEIAAFRANLNVAGAPAIGSAVQQGFGNEDKLGADILKMQEEFATKQEVLAAQLMQRQMLLDNAYMQDVISLQTYEEMKAAIEAEHAAQRAQAAADWRAREFGTQAGWMAEVNRLMQGSYRQQLQGYSIMFGQMSNLMLSSKKKEFEIGKKAAIGQALVNTYLGVSAALSYGFPLGLVFAAIQLAVGLANVARIRSQKFGGGGGATPVYSASPGGIPEPKDYTQPEPPPPTLSTSQQASTAPRNVNLTLISQTGMLEASWVRESLIPSLNEAIGDGVNLRVT